MRHLIVLSVLSTACVACAEETSKQTVFGDLKNMVLSTGSGRVRIMDPTGAIQWQHRGGNIHDCWMLETGNVLFADGQVTEVDPKTDEIVWQYKPKETKGGGAYACQRLKDGVTLVGENSTGRVLEIGKDGKVVFEMKVEPYKQGSHHNLRMVRKLANGNYLVCHSGPHILREYTPKGEIAFEVKLDNIAFSAVRLASGNTLIGHIDAITEFDPKGKPVWSFSNKDIDGVQIGWICGIHVLPNGNIAGGCYRAYTNGKGNALFEITRDKKLVWRYSDPSVDKNIMSVQVLDPDGKPLLKNPVR